MPEQPACPDSKAPQVQEEARVLRQTVELLEDLMQRVRIGEDLAFDLENPNLQPCWKVLSCTSSGCPCYGKPAMRCWQTVGTHCLGEITGELAQKLPRCEMCETYRRATDHPSHRAAETFLNVVRLIQDRQAKLAQVQIEIAGVEELRRTVEAFHLLMQQVRESGDLSVEIENPHLVTCWTLKDCNRTECPCYGKPPMRCWQVAGTHCGGVMQGVFAQKLPRCEECVVYHAATPAPQFVVGEAFLNLLLRIRHERDALLQARIAAEEGERVKSAFLANMSHEIRTPMNGVLGIAELLQQTQLDREQHEYLDLIRQSGDTLLTLINDILDFSKMEAGKLDLEETDVDVWTMFESVADLLAGRAHEKGLELACRIRPDVPRRLRGDPARIKQVLTNLLGNAVKFTKAGEVVLDITTETSDPRGTTLRIAVRDTGMGISPDALARIFEPFTQADVSMTRRFGGTGLGLTISSHLVKMMGGQLTVESAVAKGSTFTFTVKLSPPVRAEPTPTADPRILQGLRALVVDDNSNNRLVLRETLSSWGMQVEGFGTGLDAIQRFSEAHTQGQAFDVAFVDKQMPGLDGDQTIRLMRALRGGAEIPIVVVSSIGLKDDREASRQVGCNAYVTKPVRRAALRETILDVLGGSHHSPRSCLAAEPPSTPAPRAEASGKILIAEDNPVNQVVVVRILEQAGYRVVTAVNGAEALRILDAQGPFDAILMDVQMPEMDGFEATRRLRADPRWTQIPILALTAHALDGDRERCLAAGMDDYVTKPIRREVLLSKVHDFTHRAPAASSAPADQTAASWREEALSLAGGDPARLAELATAVLAGDGHVAAIRDGVATGDLVKVARQARGLHDTVSAIGVAPLRTLLRAIEAEAVRGESRQLEALAVDTERAWDEVAAVLRGWSQRRALTTSAERPALP